jgi:hypothetical protein
MIYSWEFFAFIDLLLYTLIFEKTSRSDHVPDMTPVSGANYVWSEVHFTPYPGPYA